MKIKAIDFHPDGTVKRVEFEDSAPPPWPNLPLPVYSTHPDIPYGPSPWEIYNPFRVTD